MNLTIARKDLVSLVMTVAGSAAKGASQPALNCVMIVADGSGSVVFTATDLFTGMTARSDARATEPGATLVQSAELAKAVKALPDGDVNVKIDGNRLQFAVGKAKQRVAWSPAAEYPSLPRMDPSKAIGLSSATLLLCVGSVAHSVMQDETRANMCGVKIEIGDGRCRAIATNGNTLARRDNECSVSGLDVLIPNKSVSAIKQLLERAKGEPVNIATHDGYVFVEHGNVALSAKLSGEVFPPQYERVIPTKASSRVVAAREPLLAAVSRVRTQDGGMPIAFAFGAGVVTMSAQCATGDASEPIDVDYAGEVVTVGMNAQHIAASLAAMTADDIAIEFDGPLSPIKLTHVGSDECLQIVMPARLA